MGLKSFLMGAAIGAMAANLYRNGAAAGPQGDAPAEGIEPAEPTSGDAAAHDSPPTLPAESPLAAERMPAGERGALGNLGQALEQDGQNVHLFGSKRVNAGGNAATPDGVAINSPGTEPEGIQPGLPDFARGA